MGIEFESYKPVKEPTKPLRLEQKGESKPIYVKKGTLKK